MDLKGRSATGEVMDDEERDPFEADGFKVELQKPPQPGLLNEIRRRQAPFIVLINDFERLYWDLPNLTTKQVDDRIGPMYERVLEAAAYHGISAITAPKLRECCGKVRTWPGGVVTGEALGWGLGDIVRRFTRALGFRSCEGCERRRLWLNSISWWSKK